MCVFCYECKWFSYDVMGGGVCTFTIAPSHRWEYNKKCEHFTQYIKKNRKHYERYQLGKATNKHG